MHNELLIKIGNQNHKVFLQNGFYERVARTSPLHNHNYAEIHIVTGSTALFNIEGSFHSTSKGNILVIPRGVFHCFVSDEGDSLHTAFQIDYDITEIKTCNIDTQTILEFFHEIENCKVTEDYSKIAAYISLFCSHFCSNEKLHVNPITDYGFLIHEFFSQHYNKDLHLCDLANTLHLSERQTERLIIEHTGHTFREELTATRLNMAKYLLKSSDMSLGAIAQYVGYRSYAGFWKAMKKKI